MNYKTLLDQTPRLRAWAAVGPVQRAEVEQFVQTILNSRAVGVTCDGHFVDAGDKVYVFSSTGSIQSTTVCKTVALTHYYLYDQIPVSHSFSTSEAAQNYQKHNL